MKVKSEITYQKLEKIGNGQGRHSNVYTIRDDQLGSNFVAKEIPVAQFKFGDEFFRESRLLYKCSSDHIVKIQYACRTDSHICLVMQQCTGGSLQSKIEDSPLGPETVRMVFVDVLRGLQAAHAIGVLHLDIKPSNILFDEKGRVLLTDFGQSQRIGNDGTAR